MGRFDLKKIKIVSLKWNPVQSLIQICRIWWWFSFNLFEKENTLFRQRKKTKIVSFYWNLRLRLIWIWRIYWWCSFFFCLDQKYLFSKRFFQKIKIFCWSWNLELRLIWIKVLAIFYFKFYVKEIICFYGMAQTNHIAIFIKI